MSALLGTNAECLQYSKQDFQICVTVYKARNLAVLNTNTFVMVSLNGKYKRTRTAYKTHSPYFNEYFSFTFRNTKETLLGKCIHFGLHSTGMCTAMSSCIGECSIDLRTTWQQNNHGFFKKWIPFEPIEAGSSANAQNGFLMIDLSILAAYEKPRPVIFDDTDYDTIENNLLLPRETHAFQQRVQYNCSIFRGEFVHSSSLMIRISYAGVKGRTKTSSHGKRCQWNEMVSFGGMFPSANENMLIELVTADCCYTTAKATKNIHFASISKRIGGIDQLPTFGPSWLYFYSGPQDTQYVGKVYLAITTNVASPTSVTSRKAKTTPIYDAIKPSNYYEEETFHLSLSILNVQLLQNISTQNIMMYLIWESVRSNAVKVKISKFANVCAAGTLTPFDAQLTVSLKTPDYRHKYFLSAAISKVQKEVKLLTEMLKLQKLKPSAETGYQWPHVAEYLKVLEATFGSAVHAVSQSSYRKRTKWDQLHRDHVQEQLLLLKEKISDLHANVLKNDDNESMLLDELENIFEKLDYLSQNEQNQFPDVLLHISRPSHSSPDAIYRFNAIDYLVPQALTSGIASSLSGKRCTILPRSLACTHSCPGRCGCIYAKLDCIMTIEADGIGGQAVHSADNPMDAGLCEESLTEATEVGCKIHVQQGRLFTTCNEAYLSDLRLTILFENYEANFSPIGNMLTPQWDETIQMRNVPFVATKDETNGGVREQTCTFMLVLHTNSQQSGPFALGCVESSFIRNQLIAVDYTIGGSDLSLNPLNHILRWVPLYSDGALVAEILLSAIVTEIPHDLRSQTDEVECFSNKGIPQEIAPRLRPYTMLVHFQGLRQIQRKPFESLKQLRAVVTIGDTSVVSGLSAYINGCSLNFTGECETISLYLPYETYYWPSFIIKLMDCSSAKQQRVIGIAVITNPKHFIQPLTSAFVKKLPRDSTTIDMSMVEESSELANDRFSILSVLPNQITSLIKSHTNEVQRRTTGNSLGQRRNSTNANHTWWTKFYKSLQEQRDETVPPVIKIFDRELENVNAFGGFKDWSQSFSLHKVKRSARPVKPSPDLYAIMKCKICLMPTDGTTVAFKPPRPVASATPTSIVVVVYVVQALNLTSRDIMSDSDAYIFLSFGDHCVRDRAYYIPNQASPVFGRRFELKGSLPRDQMLKLSIYDRDYASPDDLIGSTYIDIEDRHYSHHRPGFGLPKHYCTTGNNQWRHERKPSQMLKLFLRENNLPQPVIECDRIVVGSSELRATELDPQESHVEQLCLLALRNLERIPGAPALTPEHVETRSLYHPARGGIEQGKVQLWVEVYEPSEPHPWPLDITPQPPAPYELRLIVWNTAAVVLDERNIFGTEMSDIYVKCWLQELTEAQRTDVHYRSLTGEGNFNWRMIFPFRYSPADGTMVIRRRKALYEQFDTELKFPPVLTVQIWDNDSFSADDFLGTLELNLARLPVPARTADRCHGKRPDAGVAGLSLPGSARNDGNRERFINLFDREQQRQRVRGWFPMYGHHGLSQQAMTGGDDGTRNDGNTPRGITLTGKIELELELLSQQEANQRPCGAGRKAPQQLPEPVRPEISFHWLQYPGKTFQRLLWPRARKMALYLCAIVALGLLVYGLLVNLPTRLLQLPFSGSSSSRTSTIVVSDSRVSARVSSQQQQQQVEGVPTR
ncbi:fer-1-like protein 4 [Anopheles aquasalis]|uniref:fer-1-like protein 4 n=1 Tax=Anopheles aquasalis TaxID=42839 RepID=UPI00215A3BE2|nr:fer-1-like protein 4 [Anopheles aquasalis]